MWRSTIHASLAVKAKSQTLLARSAGIVRQGIISLVMCQYLASLVLQEHSLVWKSLLIAARALLASTLM